MTDLLYGEEIDKKLNWPLGRAERLARRGRLPHVVLPDGAIRLRWSTIEPLIVQVDSTSETDAVQGGQSHE